MSIRKKSVIKRGKNIGIFGDLNHLLVYLQIFEYWDFTFLSRVLASGTRKYTYIYHFNLFIVMRLNSKMQD